MVALVLFAASASAQDEIYVRVNVIDNVTSLSLKIPGFYEISDSASGRVLYRGKNLNTTVTVSNGDILMGSINLAVRKALIKVSDEVVVINGRLFRGAMEFIRGDSGKITVVNHIELEDYVKGILYHEVSHYWPYEALKAQAVVSRSFALYQREQSKGKDYDLRSDIYSQVYGGKTSERYRTNKAVDLSRGLVLTYNGKILPAYFHATCAGHTEDAALLWKTNLPPLKGVVCGYCQDSPHFNWHCDLTKKELKDKLVGAGYKLKDFKDILIQGHDPSGRIINLAIVTEHKDIIIPGKDFRYIIGPNIIRSTNFTVKLMDNDVVFEGVGWGHGVGMCQWGAYFMSKKGFTYDKILSFYYPGSKISSVSEIK